MPNRYTESHQNPRGVGDARPTALQIVKDEELEDKLTGRVFLITGCTSGIGIETARALYATGGRIFITARDLKKGEAVAKDISKGKNDVEVLHLELDSLESVRQCAVEFLKKSQTLNVLILNAGIMATPEGRTKDGFELQFGTNFVGHFLLFQLLKSTLLSSSTPGASSRVVSVSSLGHRSSGILFDDHDLSKGGYNCWKAYGQSKTANIYIANEIERRFGARGLHATSLNPGGISTGLQVHVMDMMAKYANDPNAVKIMKSVEQGAATTVWAAVAKEWEDKGGKYLEDCDVSPPVGPSPQPGEVGYATYAYDVEAATRLYNETMDKLNLSE